MNRIGRKPTARPMANLIGVSTHQAQNRREKLVEYSRAPVNGKPASVIAIGLQFIICAVFVVGPLQ
jgi:hypothetical protein